MLEPPTPPEQKSQTTATCWLPNIAHTHARLHARPHPCHNTGLAREAEGDRAGHAAHMLFIFLHGPLAWQPATFFSLSFPTSLSLSLPSHFLSLFSPQFHPPPIHTHTRVPALVFPHRPFFCSPDFLCFTSVRLSQCHLTTITSGFSSTDGILCRITAATEGTDRNPERENRVYGKRKERLAREGPGGNEVVVRGLMEEEVHEYFKVIFLGLFCVQTGFGVSRRGGSNEY